MTGGASASIVFVDIYEEAFVRRSHELLALGYRRIVPRSLASLDETAITGRLCDAMEDALDDSDRPNCATQFTTVDDQPESVRGKTGKRRPRTDVCVRCINPRPARRFRFEAKRLTDAGSLSEYLGEEGLLSLVTGYYGDIGHGGMLGYVQWESCLAWSVRIKEAIADNPPKYYARTPVRFANLEVSVVEPVFSSSHAYGQPERERLITHTLLACA